MISWLHLLWIIPLGFTLGYITCGLLTANSLSVVISECVDEAARKVMAEGVNENN